MAPPKLYCVICGKEATGTAAMIPVCDEHWRMYDEEGRKYLPMHQRTFYLQLLEAEEQVESLKRNSERMSEED
jgi:hypothetical protein